MSVTGICALARPWEGLLIGVFGGMFACLLSDAMIKLKIDDPVNCVATHAGSAVWGMIAVALFAEQEKHEGLSEENGLFKVYFKIEFCVKIALVAVTVLTFIVQLDGKFVACVCSFSVLFVISFSVNLTVWNVLIDVISYIDIAIRTLNLTYVQ